MSHDLETKRLLLRQLTLGDLDDYYRQVASDADVMKTLQAGRALSREEAKLKLTRFIEHWQRHGFGLRGMIYKPEGQLIGHCGLQFLDNTPEIELAYTLAKPYWGRGLATEAAIATLQYGFETLHLERIVAITAPTNLSSQRVMTKAGLKYKKDDRYYNHDVVYYAISREEFNKMV
jgi:ribosomal-protein-alanine N-acetyltransferase